MVFMRRSILILVSLIAGFLVPSFTTPARSVENPQVLLRSTRAEGPVIAFEDFTADYVVLSWKGHEDMALRYRALGSPQWQTATEAHDLTKGRRHYTGVLYVGGVSAIEWQPAGRVKSVPTLKVFYINTTDGPLVTRTVPAGAQAQAATPDIVTRAEWGADESLKSVEGGCDRNFYPLQQLFVHHTAGSNNDVDYYDTIRAIYAFHTQGRGWCDVGYNFLVAPDGTIFEGRWARDYSDWELHNSEDRDGDVVAGAHVGGYNSGSLGISMMGDFTSAHLTDEARASLVQMLAFESDRHDLDPTAEHVYVNPGSGLTDTLPVIAGHRDAGQTACPGNTVYKELPELRDAVAVAMGVGKSSTSTALMSSASKITYGEEVTFTGSLISDSTSLMGRAIELWKRARSRWKLVDTQTTQPDGTFSFVAAPRRTSDFEARYAGDSTTWDSASDRRTVRVRPVVTLETDRGTGSIVSPVGYAEGEKAILTGSVSPRLSDRTVVVKIFRQLPDGTETLVREKDVTVTSGSYATGYRPRQVGYVYRAVTWFPKGDGYVATRSNSVFFERVS